MLATHDKRLKPASSLPIDSETLTQSSTFHADNNNEDNTSAVLDWRAPCATYIVFLNSESANRPNCAVSPQRVFAIKPFRPVRLFGQSEKMHQTACTSSSVGLLLMITSCDVGMGLNIQLLPSLRIPIPSDTCVIQGEV